MIGNNSFNQTIDLLHRSMSTATLRQAVHANNFANVNTPNFKRTDVTFESQLGRALDSQRNRPVLELRQTHQNHISNFQPMDHREVQPRRVLDFLTQTDNNGNNVDPDHEFNLLLQNQMRYILLSQMTTFEFAQINMVARG
ncbi:MAG: flagellar basal body rod protein FlgB [Treponema sp.]|jgi:flagellar basal-body rod protein FlgB|nr:flagellar basal body rod protein FlgB [Treponema sp.]